MASYKDLVVWQTAMDLAVRIYKETERFPRHELYGLSQQMRRAAVSISSNIAEGHGRKTARQRYKFLEDALGSTFELETQVDLASRLAYLADSEFEPLARMISKVGRGLTGLMKHVEAEAREHPKRFTD